MLGIPYTETCESVHGREGVGYKSSFDIVCGREKHTLSLYSEWALNHTAKKDHHHNLLLHLAQLVYLVMLQRKKVKLIDANQLHPLAEDTPSNYIRTLDTDMQATHKINIT